MSIAGSASDVRRLSAPVAAGWSRWLPQVSDTDIANTALGALLLLGAVLFYVLPWPLFYAPALLLVFALAVRLPVVGLALTPLFAPFYMQPKHIGAAEFPPSELFLIAVTAAVLVSVRPLWRERSRLWARVSRSPAVPPLALFLLAGTVSTALAVDRHHALEWFRWTLLEPAVFFALLALLARRRHHWYLLLAAAVVAGVVVGVIGLIQFRTHQGLGSVPGTTIVRVRSIYGSPDNVGLLYDRVIPIVAASLLIPGLSAFRRAGLALVAIITIATLALTGSRGGWLAVTAGCLFVIGLRFPWGRWIVLAALVVGGVVVVAKGSSVGRAFQFGHQNTVSRRLDLWRSSLRMIHDHPWVGIGPDNFLHYYAPTHQTYIPCEHGLGYMEPSAAQEPCLSHPHDEVLDFYLSTGPLGLIAFAWLQAVFWRRARQHWLARLDGVQRGVLLGVMAAMLAALIHGLVDNSYFLVDLSMLFWLMLGYVVFQDATDGEPPYVTRALTA